MFRDLSPLEIDVLTSIVRQGLGHFREDIHNTEAAEIEAQLEAREAIMHGLMDRLAALEESGLAIGEPAAKS